MAQARPRPRPPRPWPLPLPHPPRTPFFRLNEPVALMSRLFVSDVHLDAGTPDANEQFLQFLRTHAADAEALYILGDLFEVWVGDDDPDPTKARICEGLRELTAGGVGCFVLL